MSVAARLEVLRNIEEHAASIKDHTSDGIVSIYSMIEGLAKCMRQTIEEESTTEYNRGEK